MKDFKIITCNRSFSIECGNDKLIVDIDLFKSALFTSTYVVVYNILDKSKKISFKYEETALVDKILDKAIDVYYKIYGDV